MGERVRSATWQQARDKAFIEAAQNIKPNFVQCPRCSSWVCRKSCWNPVRNLCKQCAPDLTVEISAQQSAKAVEKIRADVTSDAEDEALIGIVGKNKVIAVCPECNAAITPGAKFCPDCGAKLQEKKFCSECGTALAPTAKFCPECGAKSTG